MSEGTKIYVGADVSKDELVIAHPSAGQWVKSKVANTLLDIEAWVKGLGNEDKHFILEATGSYSHRLVHVLGRLGHKFSVVNPGQSRAMAQVLAKTNKNDEQDAHTLSLLGSSLKLRPHKMPDETQKKRTEAFSALTSLQKQEKQLLNQLHAFEYRVEPSAVATKALNNVLESVQQAIAELEKELAPRVNEEKERHLAQLIRSIKGVGEKTANTLVALFGDLSIFSSAKAFVKFLGLSPSEYSSGSSVRGKRTITKRGNSKIRTLLFNCARSAMQHNALCKELYQRLIKNGKNGKVALTAVMHKIARLIFGVVHSDTPFDPKFAQKKQKVVN